MARSAAESRVAPDGRPLDPTGAPPWRLRLRWVAAACNARILGKMPLRVLPSVRRRSGMKGSRRSRLGCLVRIGRSCLLLGLGLYVFLCLLLVTYRFFNPPVTGVQLQRKIEARLGGNKPRTRQTYVPLLQVSRHLRNAVVAAEDGRFYSHWGFDWNQMEVAIRQDLLTEASVRGASTITQQLVKNLFFTTHRFPPRKILEGMLTPVAELVMGKDRILELYLNVVEWGPGVYGAEAAARYYY
jgi:monofunctional biosynthetic peptidoglycan transglycosylase